MVCGYSIASMQRSHGAAKTIMRWGNSPVSALSKYIKIAIHLFPKAHEDCDVALSASFSLR